MATTAPRRRNIPVARFVVALAMFGLFSLALPDAAEAKFCWKSTYTRGVGKLPTACGPGREYDAGLCYDQCREGYSGVATRCYQRCPDGFRDDGLFCRKPDGYWHGRRPRASKRSCERAYGAGNCEQDVPGVAAWYKKCREGYTIIGARCSPRCPSGWADWGASCAKPSYVRNTVGTVSASCGAGQDRDAGLCYPNCRSGYDAVGPVCWGRCTGDTPVDCGAGCASTKKECRGAIKEQVLSTLRFIANIASLMTSSAGTLTAEQVDKLINDALYNATQELKDQLVSELKDAAIKAGKNIADGTYDSLEDLLRDVGGNINIDWSKIDTTGIYDVVNAFNHRICNESPDAQEEKDPPQPIRVHLDIKSRGDRENCPKFYDLTGFIEYPDHEIGGDNPPPTARYRIVRDGKYSELYTKLAEELIYVKHGDASRQQRAKYVVRLDKEIVQLGPGKHTFRLEVRDSDEKGEAFVEVECPRFEVIHAQLHFAANQGPACPQPALTQEIFITTRPGTVEYRRERQGGPPSEWLKLETQVLAGQYQAVLSDVQNVGEIDQTRRVVAKRWRNKPGTIASDWVRLKTSCIDVHDHGLTIDGPERAVRCPFDARVRLRLNADMEGPVPYRVDCDNGASFSGTAHAKETGPETFIAVAAKEVAVTKSGKLVCALKVQRRTDKGFQPVTLAGRDFTCQRPGPRDFAPETSPPPQAPSVPERVADPPRVCPQGTVGTWPNCRKRECPSGTVGKWPNCRKRECPSGTVGTWPNCRKRECPSGTVGKWPNCRKPPPARVDPPRRTCPPGMVGRPPNCRPRPCPKGQVRVRGRCIKPAG